MVIVFVCFWSFTSPVMYCRCHPENLNPSRPPFKTLPAPSQRFLRWEESRPHLAWTTCLCLLLWAGAEPGPALTVLFLGLPSSLLPLIESKSCNPWPLILHLWCYHRSNALPPLDWPLPSQFDQYELRIDVQPRPHHRAHYETEGSRGAVKATPGGHPLVKVIIDLRLWILVLYFTIDLYFSALSSSSRVTPRDSRSLYRCL